MAGTSLHGHQTHSCWLRHQWERQCPWGLRLCPPLVERTQDFKGWDHTSTYCYCPKWGQIPCFVPRSWSTRETQPLCKEILEWERKNHQFLAPESLPFVILSYQELLPQGQVSLFYIRTGGDRVVWDGRKDQVQTIRVHGKAQTQERSLRYRQHSKVCFLNETLP